MVSNRASLHSVGSADAQQLAELRVQAMRESLEALGRCDLERARARLIESFDPALTREIRVGSTRVGFLVVRPQKDHWTIEHLYVDPPAQGRGIGSWALTTVLAEADAASMPVRLGALKGSRSNAFYQRHGFVLLASTEWDNHYSKEPRRVV